MKATSAASWSGRQWTSPPTRFRRSISPARSCVSPCTGVNTTNVVTFEVKIEVTSANRDLLKPQMTANVEIIEASKSNVVMVPMMAILRKHQKTFVTVVKPDNSTEDAGSEFRHQRWREPGNRLRPVRRRAGPGLQGATRTASGRGQHRRRMPGWDMPRKKVGADDPRRESG